MNFKDRAVLLSKKQLSPQKIIATVFTEHHGLYSGAVRESKKQISSHEGDIVDFMWQARLHEHLGYAKIETIKPVSAHIISDKTKLYAFNSIISLLKLAFCEREPHNSLFPHLCDFVLGFKSSFSVKRYVEFELSILKEAGYHLQLDRCAATKAVDNLYYVSPKSGRAVSREAGNQFADRLLPLPQFLIKDHEPNQEGIQQALKLTDYFIEKCISMNREMPSPRKIFYKYLLNSELVT